METVAVPRLVDHDTRLRRGASAGLEAREAEPLLGGQAACLCFPVPRVRAGEKASACSWLHSDTWWALGAVTRRFRRPPAGGAPACSTAQGTCGDQAGSLQSLTIPQRLTLPPSPQLPPPAQSPGPWRPLETRRQALEGFSGPSHRDLWGPGHVVKPRCLVTRVRWGLGR